MLPTYLSPNTALSLSREYGTPLYVYDQNTLESQAKQIISMFKNLEFNVFYGMKALSNVNILKIFTNLGLGVSACSGFEVERALRAGIEPNKIRFVGQELPENLKEIVETGVLFVAGSLNQLKAYSTLFPGRPVGIRINPGLGEGEFVKTTTAGPAAGFGIWHEYFDRVVASGNPVTFLHTHIGAGNDPKLWEWCAYLALDYAARLPQVESVCLGGGLRVGRMPGEDGVDLDSVGSAIQAAFDSFTAQHGRSLKLELEPGTFLTANAGAIVARVIDVVDTGQGGYKFVKIDAGMSELIRPCLYGAQHPVSFVPYDGGQREVGEVAVIGHCCEKSDLFTLEPQGDLEIRPLHGAVPQVNDLAVIGGAGAYASSMSCKNYNSFPEAAEALILNDGSSALVRRRQSLDHMLVNEIKLPDGVLHKGTGFSMQASVTQPETAHGSGRPQR